MSEVRGLHGGDRTEALFHAAADLPPEEQRAFLEAARRDVAAVTGAL